MNYFPNPYQNYPQIPQSYPQMQTTTQNTGITWVQGIEGAKAYQLNPNCNAVLMDSEAEDIFYIKSSDNVGMCRLRIFKYSEVHPEEPKHDIDLSNYVTYDKLEEILGGRNEQHIQRNVNQKQPSKPNNGGQYQQNQKHDESGQV